MSEITHTIVIFLRAQSVESGPPLGTILGNLGVNTVKFCKDFNDFTKELPNYFSVRVTINIFEDRSFNFYVEAPSTGFILSLLKFERIVKKNGRDFTENCVLLYDVIMLAKFKFPDHALINSVKIILGSVVSAGLVIV